MQLRNKMLLMVSGVLGLAAMATYAVQSLVVYPSFVQLEEEEAVKNWQRCKRAIEREVEHLSLFCLDWSSWDDTYKYAKGEFPKFYDQNIGKREWFSDQRIDAFYICKPDGQVLLGESVDLTTLEATPLTWLPLDRLPADHALLKVKADKESCVNGLVMTERGLMMFASRPILTSQNTGPMAGVLILGRLLSDDFIASLRDQTQVEFQVWPLEGDQIPAEQRGHIAQAMRSGVPVIQNDDGKTLNVMGVLNDMQNESVAIINADILPSITTRGREATRVASISMIAAGLLTLAVLIAVMRNLVIRPLERLKQHALSITESGDMSRRMQMDRNDELGVLARQFNSMLCKLDEYRQQSMQMSRQAGMAEIATGVLHNVGNAVTSTSVLAETLCEKLSRSKLPGLGKAVSMMNDHQSELPRFLSEDAKGRQIPAFLGQLSDHLNHEMNQTQQDLDSLRKGLLHIREIVATQQKFAKTSTIAEPVELLSVVQQAMTLVAGTMQKHQIEVRLDVRAESTVVCDRSKLQQVLVNLLTNAKDAICNFQDATRRIDLVIDRDATGAASVAVTDHGMGISPENLAKIFTNGFTTKPDGHGFGLHYSLLAMKEMHGHLRVSSDGVGQGATFRLCMPERAMLSEQVA